MRTTFTRLAGVEFGPDLVASIAAEAGAVLGTLLRMQDGLDPV
jgi:hypothetical protein